MEQTVGGISAQLFSHFLWNAAARTRRLVDFLLQKYRGVAKSVNAVAKEILPRARIVAQIVATGITPAAILRKHLEKIRTSAGVDTGLLADIGIL